MKIKKSKGNKARGTGGSKTRLLMTGFVVALVLVVANLVFVNIYNAQDQVFIQKASDLRVFSQEIVKYAAEAASGNAASFDGLQQSRNQFEQDWTLINHGSSAYVDSGIGVLTALPGRAADISALHPRIESQWSRMRVNADLVLANRERILGLNQIAAAVTADIPRLQREYDEVVNTLLDTNAAISTIAVAQRQAWLSERIALNLSRIVTGGAGAETAVEQFQRDIALFSSNHEALLEGDISIGVNRIGNAAARARLDEVTALFSVVQEQAENIIAAGPEIIRAAQAAGAIAGDAETLLAELTALAGYFTESRGAHIASPVTGYALLLAVLVLISLYGLEVIRQSRAAEKKTAELNQRNNAAVMSLLEEISDLADGDLTVQATVGESFTGAIADSINYAVGQLRELVSAITDVTLQVSESTRSSAKTVQHLSNASERQTRSIGAVYKSVREMEQNINRVSGNAQKSLEVARNSVNIASGGADVVKDSIRGMETIREQIQESARRIKRLGENSQEIGGFVSLINDIADHTNTLSLNAAIQAAMAGDAGKGFGVVADEVHALAERSTGATKQIENLVKVIQRDINEAVSSMEQTTSEVVQGTRLAQRAGEALDDIEQVSRELAALVEEISQAAQNQSKAASEITGSMETIQQLTTETSTGTKATSTFILNLGALTQRLQDAVAGFSLSKAEGAGAVYEFDSGRGRKPEPGHEPAAPAGETRFDVREAATA